MSKSTKYFLFNAAIYLLWNRDLEVVSFLCVFSGASTSFKSSPIVLYRKPCVLTSNFIICPYLVSAPRANQSICLPLTPYPLLCAFYAPFNQYRSRLIMLLFSRICAISIGATKWNSCLANKEAKSMQTW